MTAPTAADITAALASYAPRFTCTEPQPLVSATKDRPAVVYATLVVGKHEYVRPFAHTDRELMRAALERIAFNDLFSARA